MKKKRVPAGLTAIVLASALVIRHAGLRALPGAVIAVIAAVSFVDSHIFFPRGVITMLGLAIGWTWLALASSGPARRAPADRPRASGAAGEAPKRDDQRP